MLIDKIFSLSHERNLIKHFYIENKTKNIYFLSILYLNDSFI